jgi:hypothetical protein
MKSTRYLAAFVVNLTGYVTVWRPHPEELVASIARIIRRMYTEGPKAQKVQQLEKKIAKIPALLSDSWGTARV